MHSSHDIILQAGTVYLQIKTVVDDIDWSDSRRVDSALSGCIHHMISSTGWHSLSIKTTVDDNSQTVGGLILNL